MRKLKIGLIIDEFFGALGTAYGGYGFLARRHIAKYIPNQDIQIDVLLGRGKHRFVAEHDLVDNVNVYRLPKKSWFVKRWLKKQNYDLYLSIELVDDYVLKHETNLDKKLVLWIQDPRPMYEWDEINTVTLFPETCYYNQNIYNLVNTWYKQNRIKFISQGYFLNQKAIDLYQLDPQTDIQYPPNPIDIDFNFDITHHPKNNTIIFLGRLESVKRGWLFCEIAKQLPEFEFCVLGQTFRDSSKNAEIFNSYKTISNLKFVGHVDSKEKEQFLKNAKILVNTSIHEALPISFLEALSYGTLLVSNRNPENLTEKFGIYVGDVLGDGFDKVDLYVQAIRTLINDETHRQQLSKQAIDYVRKNHSVEKFKQDLRHVLHNYT